MVGSDWLGQSQFIVYHRSIKVKILLVIHLIQQILFEAFMGPHFHSDIAIDRLVMQKGPCETPGTVPKEAVADKGGM